jgi:hypothetical protein
MDHVQLDQNWISVHNKLVKKTKLWAAPNVSPLARVLPTFSAWQSRPTKLPLTKSVQQSVLIEYWTENFGPKIDRPTFPLTALAEFQKLVNQILDRNHNRKCQSQLNETHKTLQKTISSYCYLPTLLCDEIFGGRLCIGLSRATPSSSSRTPLYVLR